MSYSCFYTACFAKLSRQNGQIKSACELHKPVSDYASAYFKKIGNYVSISQKCPSCEIAIHFIDIMILGMSNLVDHNGRTIWFEGPAGPMKPSNSKSRTKKTTNKRKNKANENNENTNDQTNKHICNT